MLPTVGVKIEEVPSIIGAVVEGEKVISEPSRPEEFPVTPVEIPGPLPYVDPYAEEYERELEDGRPKPEPIIEPERTREPDKITWEMPVTEPPISIIAEVPGEEEKPERVLGPIIESEPDPELIFPTIEPPPAPPPPLKPGTPVTVPPFRLPALSAGIGSPTIGGIKILLRKVPAPDGTTLWQVVQTTPKYTKILRSFKPFSPTPVRASVNVGMEKSRNIKVLGRTQEGALKIDWNGETFDWFPPEEEVNV